MQIAQRIKRPNPLYVDLRDEALGEPWDMLLTACNVDLGVAAPNWLNVRDELRRDLELGPLRNLVVSGQGLAWRPLVDQLAANPTTSMTRVDLYSASDDRSNTGCWRAC